MDISDISEATQAVLPLFSAYGDLAIHGANMLFASSHKTQVANRDVCNQICTNRIAPTSAVYFEVMTDVLTEPARG